MAAVPNATGRRRLSRRRQRRATKSAAPTTAWRPHRQSVRTQIASQRGRLKKPRRRPTKHHTATNAGASQAAKHAFEISAYRERRAFLTQGSAAARSYPARKLLGLVRARQPTTNWPEGAVNCSVSLFRRWIGLALMVLGRDLKPDPRRALPNSTSTPATW